MVADVLARVVTALDAMLGEQLTNVTSVQLMEHAATLDLEDFEDSELPANTVLRSDPAAGEFLDVGSAVAIWVSNGKIAVPNVLGMTESDASNELLNLGFIPAVTYREDDTVAAGTVLEQSPTAGKSAPVGSSVSIVVSQLPPDPSETPLG